MLQCMSGDGKRTECISMKAGRINKLTEVAVSECFTRPGFLDNDRQLTTIPSASVIKSPQDFWSKTLLENG